MEIGFDKEIDALLRKARGGGAVMAPNAHLDADTIAAFAENALPSASRVLSMKHLADCDRCRRILADVSLANTVTNAVEPASVAVPLIERAAPWWSGIFARGGLAVAFGAILLLFVGGIAILIIQRGRDADNTSVARVEEYQTAQAPAPPANANPATAAGPNVNAIANLASPSAKSAEPNVAAAKNGLSAVNPLSTPRLDTVASGVPPVESRPIDRERFAEAQPKTADAAPAPPPPPSVGGAAVAQSRSADEVRTAVTEADVDRKAKRPADTMTRDMPAPAAKSRPTRGPVQNQNNVQTNKLGELSVTRTAGGRNFVYRDGVYYDTAYGNQATSNVRRGTDAFNRLDSTLRSIAGTLGGTVVVVWKGKAYRID